MTFALQDKSNLQRRRKQDYIILPFYQLKLHTIGPIHKWRLFYFGSIIVQISLPSLTLEQEFFSI